MAGKVIYVISTSVECNIKKKCRKNKLPAIGIAVTKK
jgi:hypothetical protein